MNKNELISVIIPVYNAENTIENSVQSVLLSTYQKLEIILVDDGSTDNSKAICDKLSSQHKNIVVFHNENGGAARARNYGIEHANGDFISFVDSDDFITNNYFEVLYNLIKANNSDISVCAHRKVYGSHSDIFNSEIVNSKIYNDEKLSSHTKSYTKIEALKGLLYQRSFISAPWGMLLKKELFKDIRFPVGKRAEDMATIYRLFAASSGVVRTDAEMYLYYQNKSGTIYTTQSSLNPDYYEHCIDMVKFIKAGFPEASKAANSRLFSACFQILSETRPSNENVNFINKIYGTIKELRLGIIFDREGKPRNRIAAFISFISIPMLHRLLNKYYLYKLKKVRK